MDAGVAILIVVLIGGYVIYKFQHFNRPEMFCLRCHNIGQPVRTVRGSFGMEIILWALFIIPGLLYSHWRTSGGYKSCGACGAGEMVPVDSPAAQKIMNK